MTPEARSFLPVSWELPDAIAKRLGDAAGRQRVMSDDGHLLLILHRAPTPDDDEVRHPALFWRTPSGEWRSSPDDGGLDALDAHLQAYAKSIHALDHQVDTATTPSDYFAVLRWVNPLLRSSRHQLTVLQEAREALPDERRLINARDLAADVERAIDLVASDARAGMEYSLARSSAEQAHFAHEATLEARKLNRLVAFFFPLATLVAVFGMNPPENVIVSQTFWMVIAAGAVAGLVVLTGVTFARKRK
jgi:hypothetical protein